MNHFFRTVVCEAGEGGRRPEGGNTNPVFIPLGAGPAFIPLGGESRLYSY